MGVRRVAMSIMPMGIMTMSIVSMTTVPVIIMIVAAMSTMSTVVIFWLFGKLAQTSKSTGQLGRSAKQSDTREHRHIDKLTDVVADREAKHKMFAPNRRCHRAPNQYADKHQQKDTNQSAPPKNRKRFRPVDGKRPETNPCQQWKPRHDDSHQTDNNIEQGSQNVNQTEEKINQSIHWESPEIRKGSEGLAKHQQWLSVYETYSEKFQYQLPRSRTHLCFWKRLRSNRTATAVRGFQSGVQNSLSLQGNFRPEIVAAPGIHQLRKIAE